ncbi:MAG: hypothetical protein KBS46_06935 [Clostridiales bacterium]|nr:hypothetical protein [Candidatus Apopatocola equi]MCQ2439129.1 hypothetical protein [Oscillospiraceae bacterium]
MDKEKLSVSLPSAARWEAQRAQFKTTVGTDVPAVPYGEESGGVKGLFRRLVRKSVRWYAEALVTEQNRVNRQLSERIAQLEARIAELEEEKKQ